MAFTNPFRYKPHPLVVKGAESVLKTLKEWSEKEPSSKEYIWEKSLAEGKMLGILVLENGEVITAFSGTIRGIDGAATSYIPGFAPPLLDLTSPDGYYKLEEAEISKLNRRIEEIEGSEEYITAHRELASAVKEMDNEISLMRAAASLAKEKRSAIRISADKEDKALLEKLISESQFEKAELKRAKDRWRSMILDLRKAVEVMDLEIEKIKSERTRRSDDLQKWIFCNTSVHNASGEKRSIWDIFASEGIIPPGGTGDCAAPKLLEYAFSLGLKPLAMGEFWYGKSSETAVRNQGHFYPSCTSKCGPLLGFMMTGLNIEREDSVKITPIILYEDSAIIIVEKPAGMPSVPGLDGRTSLLEWLGAKGKKIHSVHRLDMDTSGVMVFAKTEGSALHLRRQFEEHTIRKTYMAQLRPDPDYCSAFKVEGSISLPLSADYDERPRQKVDFRQGKHAYTEYKVIGVNPDGTADILLYPHTGRTHQLRVHCAHKLGLGRPISGDLLYGGCSIYTKRLCLHALSITLRHPETETDISFSSDSLCF